MIALLIMLGVVGLLSGFLLLSRVPLLREPARRSAEPVSIVIPARNEELTLPGLLQSIRTSTQSAEIIVVDDHSTDGTARIATAHAAVVVTAPPLPPGWTGKNWACLQGARAANNPTLLFLDADTRLVPETLGRLAAALEDERTAISVLPFHTTRKLYEQLSLFFNLLMACGAGGFGRIAEPHLFGQSLLLPRSLYEKSGTHAAVSAEILENFALAPRIAAAGGRCLTFGGRGNLNMRMFPEGFAQLCEGWTKAFVTGANKTDPAVLAVTVIWLTMLASVFLLVVLTPGHVRAVAGAVYGILALQLFGIARQLGTFRWYTCLFYPVPLLFFFALFARSAIARARGQRVTWRGRQL